MKILYPFPQKVYYMPIEKSDGNKYFFFFLI